MPFRLRFWHGMTAASVIILVFNCYLLSRNAEDIKELHRSIAELHRSAAEYRKAACALGWLTANLTHNAPAVMCSTINGQSDCIETKNCDRPV